MLFGLEHLVDGGVSTEIQILGIGAPLGNSNTSLWKMFRKKYFPPEGCKVAAGRRRALGGKQKAQRKVGMLTLTLHSGQ